MSIEGRSLATIRSAILTLWASGMTSIGLTLDQTVGSWAYELADSLAVDALRIEGNAEALGLEIFPSTATTTTLDRQASIEGLTRQEGEVWQGTATVTGTDGVYNTTGRTLVRGGRVYAPTGGQIVVSSGTATFGIIAQGTGPEYDLAPNDVLTWSSAPTGLPPTLSVTTSDAGGTESETDALLAERVESYRRSRPAGGNPSHLSELATAHSRVSVAYIYPTLFPSGGYADIYLDTPGCVTILVAGSAQGNGASNTRDVDVDSPTPPPPPAPPVSATPRLDAINEYFQGTKDANEVSAPGGSRLYSSQVDPADFACQRPAFSGQSVDITVTNSEAYPVPWAGSMSIYGGDVNTLIVNGDQRTLANGKNVAIQLVSGAAVRGLLQVRTLGTGSYNGGTNRTTWTISPALADDPLGGGAVDPAPANWIAIVQDGVFPYFDTLGPGDVPDAATVPPPSSIARRRRFPPESWSGPASVTPAGLIRAAMSATGVIDASVTTPSVVSTPGPKVWLTLDRLRIRFA